MPRFLLCICLLLHTLLATAAPRPATVSLPEQSLEFVENKGQWPRPVLYRAEVPGGQLYLTPTGFTYSLLHPADVQAFSHHGSNSGSDVPRQPTPSTVRGHAYTMAFVGGNSHSTPLAQEPTAGTRNYFRGNNSQQWAAQVHGFRQVRYTALYAGIDVRLYENQQQQLEYDFEVAPGGRPAQIRLRYDGLTNLQLTPEGQLQLETSVGTVTEQTPRAWQTLPSGLRQPVSCRFVLSGQTVSFQLGAYNPKLPLTIDPTVLFSSFTGSKADNWGFTATYDAQGNMYSGGVAFDQGYPVSTGAFQTNFAGAGDVSIIKYRVTASGPAARLYATYLGGSGTDAPHSLVVNNLGELVILGSTGSSNFPTSTGALQRNFKGGSATNPTGGPVNSLMGYGAGSDLFISTLSFDGNRLVSSTYLGGSANDGLNQGLVNNYGDAFRGDVLTDGDNNVYIASVTQSPDFPVAQPVQNIQRGNSDAVVCKLTRQLTRQLWSTYLGGNGADAAFSLQLTPDQRLFVAGGTDSPDFPTTAGALQRQPPGSRDGFAVCFSPTGSSLQHATYLGTTGSELVFFLQLDADGDVYVLGQTSSNNYPTTNGLYSVPGAHQFIHKLSPDLTTTRYSTTFGSASAGYDISPTAFLVDDCERIYVSGWGGVNNVGYGGGSTRNLPVTSNALQRTTDGSDFYIAQFTAGLTALEYATFYGQMGGRGEHVDGGTSRFDKKGVVYQAVCGGCGGSQGFPVPQGANYYTTSNGSGNCNNAAFAISFGLTVADPGPTRYVCVGSAPVVLGGQPAGGSWSGPGVTRQPNGAYQFQPTAALVGRNVLQYSVVTTGTCRSVRPLAMIVTPERAVSISSVPTLCANGAAVTLQATPAGGIWSTTKGLSGNVFNPQQAGPGTYTLTYSISDTLGCGSATRTIVVNPLPQVVAGPNLTFCAYETQPVQLAGFSPLGGTWSGPGVTPGGLFTPPNTNLRGGIFTLTYTVTENGCSNAATRQVLLAPSPAVNFPLSVPECTSFPQYTGLAPLSCPFVPVLTGGTYTWDFGDGSPVSTEEAPTHVYQQPGNYTARLTARYANCTVETSFVPIQVGEVFVPNIITPNHDDKNETFIPRFSCRPARLQVFTRWGNKVYETDTYRNDWRAENLPDGLYYYHLKDADGRSVKGWVTVER